MKHYVLSQHMKKKNIIYSKEYYEKYKEAIKRASKKWAQKNKKRVNAYQRQWHKENRKNNNNVIINAKNSETLIVKKNTVRNGFILKVGTYKWIK